MAFRRRNPRRENERRIHNDRMRPLRVVEYLDNSAVFEKSPVEIREGFVISDRDTTELFLTILFRCVSEKRLSSLEVCIHLYQGQLVVPYRKLSFTYSAQDGTFGERIKDGVILKKKQCRAEPLVSCGEEFGQGVYIPIPESYFKKLKIELVRASYADGTTEELHMISNGRAPRFDDLDYNLQAVYSHVNIFREAEEKHPTRVLPKVGKNVWLCCCGYKNTAERTFCEKCGRDKEWQIANLSSEKLTETMHQLVEDRDIRLLYEKSDYSGDRVLMSDQEREEKEEQCRQVLKRLAEQEREMEHRRNMILPKLLLVGLAIAFLVYLLNFLDVMLGRDESKPSSANNGANTTVSETVSEAQPEPDPEPAAEEE